MGASGEKPVLVEQVQCSVLMNHDMHSVGRHRDTLEDTPTIIAPWLPPPQRVYGAICYRLCADRTLSTVSWYERDSTVQNLQVGEREQC